MRNRVLTTLLILLGTFNLLLGQGNVVKHCYKACPGESLKIGAAVVMDPSGCLKLANSTDWPIAGVVFSYEVVEGETLWCPFNEGVLVSSLDSTVKAGDVLGIGDGGKLVKKSGGNAVVGVALENGDSEDSSLERFAFLGYQDSKAPYIVISQLPDRSGDIVCPDTGDNSPYFKEAIDNLSRMGGGVIYVRRGVYEIHGLTVDTVINITLIGGKGTHLIMYPYIKLGEIRGLTISDLKFESGDTGSFYINFGETSARDLVIKNCMFDRVGVYVSNGVNVVITNNSFTNILSSRASAISVNCDDMISGGLRDTVFVYPIVIKGNNIINSIVGISVIQAVNVFVKGNFVRASIGGSYGIELIKSDRSVITNNFVIGFSTGIIVSAQSIGGKEIGQESKYNVVSFNTIDSCFSACVSLLGDETNECNYNFVYGNTGSNIDTNGVGVKLEYADSNLIFNNLWHTSKPYLLDGNSFGNIVVGLVQTKDEIGYLYSVSNFPDFAQFRPYEVTIWNEKYDSSSYVISIDTDYWQSAIIDFTAKNSSNEVCVGYVAVAIDSANVNCSPVRVYSSGSSWLEIEPVSAGTKGVIFRTLDNSNFSLGYSIRKLPKLRSP